MGARQAREWTEQDKCALFQKYFDDQPATCPVCSSQVQIIMDQIGDTVALLMHCDGCGTKARISRSRDETKDTFRRA